MQRFLITFAVLGGLFLLQNSFNIGSWQGREEQKRYDAAKAEFSKTNGIPVVPATETFAFQRGGVVYEVPGERHIPGASVLDIRTPPPPAPTIQVIPPVAPVVQYQPGFQPVPVTPTAPAAPPCDPTGRTSVPGCSGTSGFQPVQGNFQP